MEVTSGAEEGFVREWTPCSHILNLIPPRIQTGLFSNELCLTCVDAVSEYLALGTNVGLVYWYDRKKGNIQRLRCEASTSPITYVKIVNTVDYMVGAGNAAGQVTVFQIPKEHPENVPDTFKPKVEPKVERYTIGDLHKSKITAIEWSKNGMRLFSGDKDGVIIMTEIDFYMHLCKSMEIVNEQHEIVQLSYCQGALLVSSVYRCIVCERRDARWHVSQLGKKERRSLCALGATFQYSYARGGGGAAPAAYCARPGLRLWRADRSGEVLQTLLFKEAISNPLTVAELLNPAAGARGGVKGAERERQLGALHVFRDQFLVAHDEGSLYILDPRSLTAVAVVDDLRRILSVSVNKDEIFVLEGPRSLVRLAHAPEPAALAPEEPGSLMSKSLQHSLAAVAAVSAAVSSVRQQLPRDLLDHADQLGVLTRSETPDTGAVSNAEECFELPPVRQLPAELAGTVLQSIVAEFRDVAGDVSGDVSDADELRRARALELHRKLKMYDSIMERKREGEVIHSSRRSRRREPAGEGGATPRRPRSASHTGAAPPAPPAAPAITDYGDVTRSGMQENDDLLEQQIEEKEKILAKMLNLESLSIKSPEPAAEPDTDMYTPYEYKEVSHYNGNQPNETESEKKIPEKKIKLPEKPNQKKPPEPPSIIDLVPKVVELPNNWNLENFELRLDMKNGLRGGGIISPDDNLDSEWEVI